MLGVEPEPFTLGEHLVETSAKLTLLDKLLTYIYHPFEKETLMKNDLRLFHKVLIFSKMTKMLDIIQDYLTLRGSIFVYFIDEFLIFMFYSLANFLEFVY